MSTLESTSTLASTTVPENLHLGTNNAASTELEGNYHFPNSFRGRGGSRARGRGNYHGRGYSRSYRPSNQVNDAQLPSSSTQISENKNANTSYQKTDKVARRSDRGRRRFQRGQNIDRDNSSRSNEESIETNENKHLSKNVERTEGESSRNIDVGTSNESLNLNTNGKSRQRDRHRPTRNRINVRGGENVLSENEGDAASDQKNLNSNSRGRNRRGRFSHGFKSNSSSQKNDQQSPSLDIKGKGKEVANTNNTSGSSAQNKPTNFPRSNRASIMKMSPSEINDVLTSITHGLTTSTYECMICWEVIRPGSSTWSCNVCWAVFHLRCAEKWAKKSSTEDKKNEGAWRCPGCQHKSTKIPTEYWCFCGKVQNPENNRYFTPHTCGQTCGRQRDCPHDCTMQCHPGPCPPCNAMAPVQVCYCGRQSFQTRCVDTDYTSGKSCGQTCGQKLQCGFHYCESECHKGPCPPCRNIQTQSCYCGRVEREDATCGEGNPIRSCAKNENGFEEWTGYYRCENICDRLLECGHHRCEKPCHPLTVEPEPCPFDPSRIKTCPCGSKSVESLLNRSRTLCTDEIPLCGNKCNKPLPCGHNCQDSCHMGDCSSCNLTVRVSCRCGSTEFEKKCSEISKSSGELPTCDKICEGFRTCGKHQCNARCCPSANRPRPTKKLASLSELEHQDENHQCTLICGKKLKCGNHNCQMLCHRGHCLPCLEASFEELTCHCGRTKVYPPIPCGTEIPPCPYPCNRTPQCDHAGHLCHPDTDPCPPCHYLVEKMCMCGRSMVKNVRCHKKSANCGQICDRMLPCGGHRCNRTCHSGDCLVNDDGTSGVCMQPCGKPRKSCPHPCTASCHAPSRCPEDRLCQSKVVLVCKCGNLKQEMPCYKVITQNVSDNGNQQLACNDSCDTLERNRRLAEALELTDRSTDGLLSTKVAPKYTDELLKYYMENKVWAKNIESTLNEFMKSKKQSLDLKPMKAPYRKFIHELCTHYRLASESIDEEPYRSVYIKKKPDSIIPPMLLAQVIATPASTFGSTHAASSSVTSSSTALEQLARKPKQAVNGLYLAGLAFGLTQEKLQKDLEPLMGRLKFVVKWVTEDDAIVMPVVGSMQMSELEIMLMRLKTAARDTLVAKGITSWVELCWVNQKYEIVWRERGKLLNNLDNLNGVAGSSTDVVTNFHPPVENSNPFEILQDSSGDEKSKQVPPNTTSNRNSVKQVTLKKVDSVSSQNIRSNICENADVPDDWEMCEIDSDDEMSR